MSGQSGRGYTYLTGNGGPRHGAYESAQHDVRCTNAAKTARDVDAAPRNDAYQAQHAQTDPGARGWFVDAVHVDFWAVNGGTGEVERSGK